jgi:carboxyl-terminal processing protease
MRQDISGEFGGLGIEIGVRERRLTVIAPMEGTPAWREGIKAGDWIVEIEGQPTSDMRLNEAVHKMRGVPGTKVTITIMREGFKEPRKFTIVREVIKAKSVREAKLMPGGIGYIKLSTFTETTDKDLKEALKKLADEAKGRLRGLVLDLRGNPGGPLDQAVNTADLFLAEGVIVSVKGRTFNEPPRYAHRSGDYENIPMVVIVNQLSASASEIVAGALKDHRRAVILGQLSFGKGSVQQLRTLKDGSGLKLTTAYYYTPSGRTIQEEGILPDIEVEDLSPEQAIKAIEEGKDDNRHYMREKDLSHHFTNADVTGEEETEGAPANPEAKPEGGPPKLIGQNLLPPTVGKDTDDYQLQRALDLLRDQTRFQAVLKRKPS